MIQHSWNAERSGNQFTFRGKWSGFKLPDGTWRPINTAITPDFSLVESPYKVQFPVDSQGTCSIHADGRFSMRRHVLEKNGDNSENAMDLDVIALCERNVTGHIDPLNPNRILYPDAWPGTTFRYGLWHGRSLRVEKVLEIDPAAVPSGPLKYKFHLRSSSAKMWRGSRQGRRLWKGQVKSLVELEGESIFLAHGDSQLRGVTLRPAVAWWFADGKMIRKAIRLRIESIDAQTTEITKVIPAAFVRAARKAGSKIYTDATLYPDPHPEASTSDGYTQSSGAATWSTLHAAAGTGSGDSDSSSYLNMLQAGAGSPDWLVIRRLLYGFDTSSMSGEPDAWTLSITTGTGGSENINSDFNVYSSSPASDTAIVNADHDLANWGTTAFSDTNIDASDLNAGGTQSWSGNAAGLAAIDTEGITNLGIRSVPDADDAEPSWPGAYWSDGPLLYFADESGLGNDPVLEITEAVSSSNQDMLGMMSD